MSESERSGMIEGLKEGHELAFRSLLERLKQRKTAGEELTFRMNQKELAGFIPQSIFSTNPSSPDKVHVVAYPVDEISSQLDFAIYDSYEKARSGEVANEMLGISFEAHDVYSDIMIITDFHLNLEKIDDNIREDIMSEFMEKLCMYAQTLGVTIIFHDANDADLRAEMNRRGGVSTDRLNQAFYDQHPLIGADTYSGAEVLFLDPREEPETFH